MASKLNYSAALEKGFSPMTIINDRVQIVGSISEATVLEGLTQAISHGH